MSLSNEHKWIVSLIAAALFFLFSSPMTYGVTNKVSNLIGFNTTHGPGPTYLGLLIHTVVFMILFRVILIWAA